MANKYFLPSAAVQETCITEGIEPSASLSWNQVFKRSFLELELQDSIKNSTEVSAKTKRKIEESLDTLPSNPDESSAKKPHTSTPENQEIDKRGEGHEHHFDAFSVRWKAEK
jgi:hypothetical protein